MNGHQQKPTHYAVACFLCPAYAFLRSKRHIVRRYVDERWATPIRDQRPDGTPILILGFGRFAHACTALAVARAEMRFN